MTPSPIGNFSERFMTHLNLEILRSITDIYLCLDC